MRQRSGHMTVKGTSRRVVIVPGEENSVFEQIICVVRDETASRQGVSAEAILQEAESILAPDPPEEDEETPPRFFSGAVLILMLIAFVLSAALLIYLHLHGWP